MGWWVDGLQASGATISAVLGFCASSAHALALMHALENDGISARAILVDPTTVDRSVLYEFGFVHVVDMFRGVLSTDEFEAALWRAHSASGVADDLSALAAQLELVYQDMSQLAFARAGILKDQAEELSEVVAGYLHFLRVAGELGGDLASTAATAIRSVDYPGSMTVEESVECSSSHDTILAQAWTGRTVASLLEGTAR